jgi:hypothetical protein
VRSAKWRVVRQISAGRLESLEAGAELPRSSYPRDQSRQASQILPCSKITSMIASLTAPISMEGEGRLAGRTGQFHAETGHSQSLTMMGLPAFQLMGFRFRRSARLGPLRFHFSNRGLSSISVGGRGASLNIPVTRRGGIRTTVGLPGTGLSWSEEVAVPRSSVLPQAAPLASEPPLPNSRRLRPSQLEVFRRCCLRALHGQLFAAGSPGSLLWEQEMVSRLLADPSLAERQKALLAAIETPDAMERHLQRAQSLDDAKRRANRCIAATQEAIRLAAARGWIASAQLPCS